MEKEWVSMYDRKTADELGYKLCYDKDGCIINRQENDGTTSTLMAFIRPVVNSSKASCCEGGPHWGHAYGCKNVID